MDKRVSRGQRGGSPTIVNLSFLDRNRYFSERTITEDIMPPMYKQFPLGLAKFETYGGTEWPVARFPLVPEIQFRSAVMRKQNTFPAERIWNSKKILEREQSSEGDEEYEMKISLVLRTEITKRVEVVAGPPPASTGRWPEMDV
jgi:hypothetical protein